jgi:hypothetical protein
MFCGCYSVVVYHFARQFTTTSPDIDVSLKINIHCVTMNIIRRLG